MNRRVALGASLAVALLVGGALAAEGLKSGPQPGSKKILPFNPLNVTGADAGKKTCQV
jgi:hypothetical protein